MFWANFCPSSGAQDWDFFTAYGIVSRKDGYTNSYVVRMWYVVLINVIVNWWVCNVMFRYLLVLYANVYGKIVAYVVVREFVFWVRNMLSSSWRSMKLLLLHLVGFYITLPTLIMHGQTQIKYYLLFMFVPCINSIKTLFYYSKLMHKIIKS